MIRVLLADDIVRAAAVLNTLVGTHPAVEVCGIARTPATLPEDLRALMPDAVLIRERFAGLDARPLAAEVPELSPGTRVVLLTDDPRAGPPFPTLPAGVECQLSAQPTAGELLAALDGARASPGAGPSGEEGQAVQELVPRRRARGSGRTPSELFVVFAGKGGVGKSVVSTNLSSALAKDGARVAIIDLDLQFGDVGVMLGVEHPHTIEELVPLGDQMETEFLEEIMGTGPEGVRVLLAPTSPELADLVTAGTLRAIIRELGKSYDYIVVDAPAHLEERTLEMIELADHIVVVTAFNVTAVKDTKITLKLLQSLGIDREKIAVVLNQTRARANFTREEVEDSLRFRIVTQLSFEPRIVDDSVDQGKPFVLSEPRSEISRQFRTLVDYLVPAEDEAEGDGRAAKGRLKDKPKGRRFSLGRST